jgi:subfamily B ATP-binding cassette protein MsbA
MSDNCTSTSSATKRLFRVVRPYWYLLVSATMLMIIGVAIELLLPYLTGKIIDAALLENGLIHLKRIVFWFIAICVIMGVFRYFQEYLIGLSNAHILRDLRTKLFNHFIILTPDFYESRRVGELLSRLGSDFTAIQGFLTGSIPAGIRSMVLFFGTLLILLLINIHLTLLALVTIPTMTLATIMFGQWTRKLATRQQDALAEASAIAEETLNGIRTVQSANREAFESGRYCEKLNKLWDVQIKSTRLTSSLGAILLVAQHVASILVLWYGGYLIIKHMLTPGQLVSFMLYTAAMGGAIGTLGGMYVNYQNVLGASVRVFELLGIHPSVKETINAAPLAPIKGSITFQGVSFQYPTSKSQLTLENIHFEVQPGEMIGLVGPSGAGKSTLFSLMLRFYDPSAGIISIDGRDISSIRLNDLRQVISIVPQEIFLFSGTVAENISFYKPNATLKEILAAATAANADEFIGLLKNGYKELVGQRGIKLSAGQRQRIAIARAFIINPAILLLDEATSSLDPESEEKIKCALSNLTKRRTTFVIAHRLTTARQADRILVMDRGRIVGSGTHDALYQSNAIYRKYWILQSLTIQNEDNIKDQFWPLKPSV